MATSEVTSAIGSGTISGSDTSGAGGIASVIVVSGVIFVAGASSTGVSAPRNQSGISSSVVVFVSVGISGVTCATGSGVIVGSGTISGVGIGVLSGVAGVCDSSCELSLSQSGTSSVHADDCAGSAGVIAGAFCTCFSVCSS